MTVEELAQKLKELDPKLEINFWNEVFLDSAFQEHPFNHVCRNKLKFCYIQEPEDKDNPHVNFVFSRRVKKPDLTKTARKLAEVMNQEGFVNIECL